MPRRSVAPPQRFTTIVCRLWKLLTRPFIRGKVRYQNFLSRRPHRSFRLTRRRDKPAYAPLPSNTFFTSDVISMIRRHRNSYLIFIVVYALLFTLFTGIINQDSYQTFSNSLKELGPAVAGGDLGKAGETMALFASVVSGQLNESLSEAQQIYVAFLSLAMWMSIVWFLRHRLQDMRVNVRDSLYNSMSPLLPTLVVSVVGLLQLIPGAVGVLVYSASSGTGIINGVESMVFGIAAILLVVLSLYWVTGTLFALIIVTIPGTYPFRALSLAGDVVVGRRSSLLLRLVWMAFVIGLIWLFVLIPAILLADALPWKWLPIVPIVTQLLAGMTIVFSATYVYLLYRRMIDAAPKKRSKKPL